MFEIEHLPIFFGKVEQEERQKELEEEQKEKSYGYESQFPLNS